MLRVLMKSWIPGLVFLCLMAAGCSTAPKLTPEQEETLKAYWRLYMHQSPEWEQAKKEWLAMGDAARQCLLHYLLLDIRENSVKTTLDALGNPEPGWKRSVQELEALGEEALPALQKYLKTMRDETVALPFIVATAKVVKVEEITAEVTTDASGDDISYHCRLVKVLFHMEDPRTLDEVLRILNEPYDWQVRATAAVMLRQYRGPRMAEVKASLEQASKDEDPSVKDIAGKSLKALERLDDDA